MHNHGSHSGHSHAGHAHAPATGTTRRVLQLSLAATILYVIVCFAAGVRAHSLALLSEGGHNISDAAALALSFAALWLGARPASPARTFGYQRAGVLAAFFNALALVAVSTWIVLDALARLRHPQPVHTTPMIAVAAAGVLMNGAIATLLWRAGARASQGDLNLRSVFVHMAGDTLSTAAVIAGALLIRLTGYQWIDPALSIAIAALILWSSIAIVRETLNILLEGTPRGIDLTLVTQALTRLEGVEDVHDLHVWSLSSETHALATHIRIADIPVSQSEAILERIRHELRDRFRIVHTTIQFEHIVCATEHGCVMAIEEAHAHNH